MDTFWKFPTSSESVARQNLEVTASYTMRLILALAAGLGLLGAGGLWWRDHTTAKGPAYRTAELARGDIVCKVSATGTLQAVTRVEVGSQVSGIITSVQVSHNSVVRRGQVLAQLDPGTYQTAVTQAGASVTNAESSLANAQADAANASANVRSAQAAVVSAQAAVEQAQVGVISGRASIAAAEARVEKARSLADNARKSYERNRDLYGRDLISQADLDASHTDFLGAEADVESARADLAGAEAGLRSAEVTVGAKQTEVESARIKKEAAQELVAAAQARVRGYQAQLEQARAGLRTAQINLERTTITSPIDGVVLDVAITAGQTVAAQLQAPNLFTLAEDLSLMQVETSVDEADISKVKTGAAAEFTVDAFPEDRFQGKVTEVRQSPVTTNGVVTYMTIVRTHNPGGKLRPGMTATVEIVDEKRAQVLKIPNEALSFKPDGEDKAFTGARVFTVEEGTLVAHQVTIGLTDGSDSELLTGDLQSGQEVVLAVEGATETKRAKGQNSRPGPPGMF